MSNNFLQESDEDSISSWELPYVEDTRIKDDSKTNALNRKSDWKYEPPEPEEEILPPTAEEIEAIRAAAYQDGFEQGKTEGLEKGLEEGREQGHQEGLEKGHQEGFDAGMSEGKEQSDQLIATWQSLLEQLHQPVAQVEDQLQKELVLLAVSLARTVIRTEVKTNNDIIFQALSEGLKVLPIQENRYQIHLNPEDIALVKSHFSEQEIEQHNWTLVESPQMSRGGCDITTESNAVDVSIERRTRDVLDKFILEQGLDQIEPPSQD